MVSAGARSAFVRKCHRSSSTAPYTILRSSPRGSVSVSYLKRFIKSLLLLRLRQLGYLRSGQVPDFIKSRLFVMSLPCCCVCCGQVNGKIRDKVSKRNSFLANTVNRYVCSPPMALCAERTAFLCTAPLAHSAPFAKGERVSTHRSLYGHALRVSPTRFYINGGIRLPLWFLPKLLR